MTADVALSSAAVSLLAAYNRSQEQMDKIQAAVSTGYDVNSAADNVIYFVQAQEKRSKVSWYKSNISKISQEKSKLDSLNSTIQTVSSTASKIVDLVNSISVSATNNSAYSPSVDQQRSAVKSIETYINTIQNLLSASGDPKGFSLNWNTVTVNIAPPTTGAAQSQSMQFACPGLDVSKMFCQTSSQLPPTAVWGTYVYRFNGKTHVVADMSTSTNRAAFSASVSNWIDTVVARASTTVGVYSNSLDALLTSMHTNQNALSAEADALTKTDLTADAAKTAALQTQQQLLTNLLSMSNQRMSAIVSLFR